MTARWLRVIRTPLGLTATVLTVAVLALAVLAPVLWGDRRRGRRHRQHPGRTVGEHWAGTDNLGRDILLRVLVATRLSVVLALLATAIARGRRPAARRRAVPARPPARAGWSRRRSTSPSPSRGCCWRSSSRWCSVSARTVRCWPSGWLAPRRSPDSPRPWWPASRLVTSSRPRRSRAWAGSGSCSATSCPTSPNRWSSTPPSAPAARCSPSPASPSSASACSRRPTTGGGCSTTVSARSTSNPAAALAPGAAVLLAGLAFSLFGESVAKRFGVPVVAGLPRRAGGRRPHAGRRRRGSDRWPVGRRRVRRGPRRPRPRGHLRRTERPDPPGPRA